MTTLQYGLTLTGMLNYLYFSSYWKSRENSQDFFVKTKTKTETLGLKTETLGLKTETLGLKTKTSKTLLFVVEAPRDQDLGLEVCITAAYLRAVRPPMLRSWWSWWEL